ncbi:hypothetical protein [Amycolatopsis sp. cmx-4-83]|uniref:hypothetical protein n=1 Tax=Amycolatopsis TaxID=1813 RepID=UPI00397A6B7D
MDDAAAPAEEYEYRPVLSVETGSRVRMRSQERAGVRVVKVATPRVGTDGLREVLKERYGLKKK